MQVPKKLLKCAKIARETSSSSVHIIILLTQSCAALKVLRGLTT